jgi:hypothetical protein
VASGALAMASDALTLASDALSLASDALALATDALAMASGALAMATGRWRWQRMRWGCTGERHQRARREGLPWRAAFRAASAFARLRFAVAYEAAKMFLSSQDSRTNARGQG